jgi:hypothetical protein
VARPTPDASRRREGYGRALEHLHRCSTDYGFVASAETRDDSGRVWGRGGVITGLAALAAEDPSSVACFPRTLLTLAQHQGPHGEMPSNVDPQSGRVGYGGTAERVDADLWFVVGAVQYRRATADRPFLELLDPVLERVRRLLGAWEFNNRGLVCVPQTGDWADEHLHAGSVPYDQLLSLRAQQELAGARQALTARSGPELTRRCVAPRRLNRGSYWSDGGASQGEAYHRVLRSTRRKAASHCAGRRWFDAFATVPASLLGVASREQAARVHRFLREEALAPGQALLPAFHPVITPRDADWEHLQSTFSYTLKHRPYEYHDGGLWPTITGFYAADLQARGEAERAGRFARGVHRANRLARGGAPWEFREYVHGRRGRPGAGRCCWPASRGRAQPPGSPGPVDLPRCAVDLHRLATPRPRTPPTCPWHRPCKENARAARSTLRTDHPKARQPP